MVEQIKMIRCDVADVNERIAATERILKETDTPRAWELTLRGLLYDRERLLAELCEAIEGAGLHRLSVEFGGDALRSDLIAAGFLGKALSGLQDMLDALVQSVSGKPTQSGPVSGETAERASLYVAATAPGSFHVVLAGFEAPDLFGITHLEPAIDGLMQIVEASTDPQRAIDILERYGSRAYGRFSQLTKSLSDHRADMSLSAAGEGHTQRTVSISSDIACQLQAQLAGYEEDAEYQRELSGTIVGVLPEGRRFEFRDDETKAILDGEIAPDIVAIADEHVKGPVLVTLLVRRRKRSKQKQPVVTHMLVGVEPHTGRGET